MPFEHGGFEVAYKDDGGAGKDEENLGLLVGRQGFFNIGFALTEVQQGCDLSLAC